MLELGCVVLIDPERCRRLCLHVFGRRVHRLVRSGVVGLRNVLHMLAPSAAVPGHLAGQVLLQRLDGPVNNGRGVAVARVFLSMHHTSGQGSFQALEFVALVRRDHIVPFVLHQIGDDLRGRLGHRLSPLVGQRLCGHLPCEHVCHHQPVLVRPSSVLGKIHEVRLQPIVRPLGRRLPQAPRLGCEDLPRHITAQGRLGPCRGEVPPLRKLPAGDLVQLAGITDVEVPGQPPKQLHRVVLRHFYSESSLRPFFLSSFSTRFCSFLTMPHSTTLSF